MARLELTHPADLDDADYAAGVAALGREKLAELTWLAGYYATLALALAVFQPELPAEFWAAAGSNVDEDK